MEADRERLADEVMTAFNRARAAYEKKPLPGTAELTESQRLFQAAVVASKAYLAAFGGFQVGHTSSDNAYGDSRKFTVPGL